MHLSILLPLAAFLSATLAEPIPVRRHIVRPRCDNDTENGYGPYYQESHHHPHPHPHPTGPASLAPLSSGSSSAGAVGFSPSPSANATGKIIYSTGGIYSTGAMYSTGGIYGSGYFNGTSGSAGPSVGPVGFSTGPGMVIPTGSPVGTGKYPSYGTGYYYPTDKGTGSIPFATGKMSTGTETPSASAVLASTGSGKPSGAGVNYTYHPSGTGPKYTYKPSGTSKPLPSGFQPGGPIKNITSHVPYPTGSGVAISGYNPGGPIMNITTTVHKVSTVHISPTPASGLPSGAKNISSSPSAGGVAAIGSGLGYYPIPSSSKPYSGSLLSSSPVLASPVSGSGSSSYPTASGAISTSPTTSSDKDKTTPYTGQKTASSPMASATGSGSSPIPSSAGAVGISSSEESSSSSTPTVTSTGGIKITISTVHPVPTEYYYHHRRPKHHGHHEPDYGYGESSDDYGYGSEPTEDEGGYGYGGYGYFK